MGKNGCEVLFLPGSVGGVGRVESVCGKCAWIQRGGFGGGRRLRRRAEAVKVFGRDRGFGVGGDVRMEGEGGEEGGMREFVEEVDGVGDVLPNAAGCSEGEFVEMDGGGGGVGGSRRSGVVEEVCWGEGGEVVGREEDDGSRNCGDGVVNGSKVEGAEYLNGWHCIDTFVPYGSNSQSLHITSLSINLTGPSNKSLFYYMNDLRPKIDYLEAGAREKVLRALEIANVAHEGQKRKSGEPFIIHPVAVASILAEMKMDRDSIIAGLLHDTVEDTPVTLEELEELFGTDVRKIVEGETKFSKLAKKVQNQKAAKKAAAEEKMHKANGTIPPPSQEDNTAGTKKMTFQPLTPWEFREQEDAEKEAEQQKQADNLRNMFLAMTEDVRVIIVKLADRLHNLRTLQHMPKEKQKKIAKETLEFFTPLAHRLGMSRIKTELEELSFKYMYPNECRNLSQEILATRRRFRMDNLLADTSKLIKDILVTDGIMRYMVKSVEVYGVHKPIYTVFRRMRKGVPLQSMRDIASIQVVLDLNEDVDSVPACYHVLGRIHRRWRPLPNRVKDYIAFPKPNGYQCLHTTVLVEQHFGFHPLEVHICTKDMHRIAEEGIAAELFHNKSNLSGPQNGSLLSPTPRTGENESDSAADDRGPDEEWKRRTKGWLITIREYIQDFSSSRDAVDAVRRDLLGNRVHVFTPQGRIIDLPHESTPVDLAYHIHTEIGQRMIGAKVNGHMVSLDYKLQNADSVKIITSGSSPGPSPEWMGYAKSRTARQKIRQFLRARDRDNMIDVGRSILTEAAKYRRDPIPSEAAISETLPRLATVLNAPSGARSIRSIDDLYIAIARGGNVRGLASLEEITLDMLRDRRKSVFQNAAPHGHDFYFYYANGNDESLEHGTHEDARKSKPSIELGACCHPLRDDQIVGIRYKEEHKIVVHRLKCEELGNALCEEQAETDNNMSMVDVRWSVRKHKWSTESPAFSLANLDNHHNGVDHHEIEGFGEPCQPACILVTAEDCDGLLSHLSGIIARCGKSIRRSSTVTDAWTSVATFAFEVLVEGAEELERVIHQLCKESEVKNARRLGPNENEDFFPPGSKRSGSGGWADHFSMIEVVSEDDKDLGSESDLSDDKVGVDETLPKVEGSLLLESWSEDEGDNLSEGELGRNSSPLQFLERNGNTSDEVEIDELE